MYRPSDRVPEALSPRRAARHTVECDVRKGTVAERGFAVAMGALKANGTSGTGNTGLVARMFRDLSMGLVQAFPSERGKLEAAAMMMTGSGTTQFAGTSKPHG